jgi:hypothetical protein
VDLLDTVGAELDVGGEVLDALVLVEGRVDKGGLDDVLLALGGLEEGLGEAGTGHGHGEGGGTGTVLGLDDLVTAELDALDVLLELLAGEVVAGLGEERDDGSTGVATDDGDVLVGGVGVLDLRDEARGADDVKGGDTEEALGVVNALGLEDLGADGDGRVDLCTVSLSSHMALPAARTGLEMMRMLASGAWSAAALARSRTMEALVLNKSGRRSVVEQAKHSGERTVTGHAGLAGDTSGNEDDLSALEGLGQASGRGIVSADLVCISNDAYLRIRWVGVPRSWC